PPRTLLPSHIHSPMALNSFTTAARARPRRESEIRRLYNDQRWDATARQSRSQNYKRLWGRRGPLVRSACTSGGQEERERRDGSGGGGGGGDGCGGDGGGGGSLQSPSAPEGAEVLLAHVRGRPRGHQAGARSLPVEAARGVQL
ncbi:unnamed protein product, partial [Prorocentrum cordatum]